MLIAAAIVAVCGAPPTFAQATGGGGGMGPPGNNGVGTGTGNMYGSPINSPFRSSVVGRDPGFVNGRMNRFSRSPGWNPNRSRTLGVPGFGADRPTGNRMDPNASSFTRTDTWRRLNNNGTMRRGVYRSNSMWRVR